MHKLTQSQPLAQRMVGYEKLLVSLLKYGGPSFLPLQAEQMVVLSLRRFLEETRRGQRYRQSPRHMSVPSVISLL